MQKSVKRVIETKIVYNDTGKTTRAHAHYRLYNIQWYLRKGAEVPAFHDVLAKEYVRDILNFSDFFVF